MAGELVVDREWLGRVREPPYVREQPIIDPHIHLWLGDPLPYNPEDYLADAGGHIVEATVYAQCYSEYLSSGPAHLRPVGEVRFALEQSSRARSIDASVDFCAAIIGYVDLGPPELVREAVEAQVGAGEGRLRALRPELYSTDDASTALLRDERWDQWADALQRNDLLLEAWVSYRQLRDLAQLATRYPEVGIVLNHLGGPVGAALHDVEASDMRTVWLDGMRMLSACPNVAVKLGGMGTSVFGYRLWSQPEPPTSSAIAALWRPWIEPVIDQFGPDRCMFESNYPVDARVGGLDVLWNCFKMLCEPYSGDDRDWLCRKTAARTYWLDR
jgi:predicted TIM-barrel fold metal-dependent hydrolase